ncbi:MAG: PspC domain-containing protein [Intrasporangiaceae bacterium]|nr:PspC domain-containing protein [Intrasporangiaceae bacterium]
MTDTQPQDQTHTSDHGPSDPGPAPSSTKGFFDQIRAFGVRRTSDRWVAGVGGGLARRLGVDPLLIRAAFIALLIFGIGFLAYLIAWALLPDENDSIVAERAIHDGDGWGIFLIIVIALSVFGVGPFFTGADGWWSLVMTLALIAGIWWLVTRTRDSGAGAQPGPQTSPQGSAPSDSTVPQPVWAPAGTSHAGYEPKPSTPPQGTAYASSAYRRPKAPSAGLAGFLLVLGAAVVGYGLGQVIGARGDASADLVAMLGATAAAGLTTIILGLLGRRSGLTGLLSIGLAVSLLLTWGITTAPEGGGNKTWSPDATSLMQTYEWNAGQATLDLRDITVPPEQQDITATVSFGELVVYVPEGITTRVVSDAWLGGVSVDGTDGSSVSESQEGPSVTTEHVFGEAAEPDLTVRANVRLGSIRIVTPTDPS